MRGSRFLCVSQRLGAILYVAALLCPNACGDPPTRAATIVDDFEDMEVGRPIVEPWQCRSPKGPASVKVTDRKAASGQKSLAITYNIAREDRHRELPPWVIRPIRDTGLRGTAVFEGNMLFDPSTDTRIVVCLLGGPGRKRSVSLLNGLGKLHFASSLVWNPVRRNKWYHFKFVIHKAAGTADLTVSEKDGTWQNVFRNVRVGKPQEVFPLKHIRIYFGGRPRKGACVYFDDLKFLSSPTCP